MLFGSKNLEEFEKEFDNFISQFSKEELLNELKEFCIQENDYNIKKPILSESKDEYVFMDDISSVKNNILNPYVIREKLEISFETNLNEWECDAA